MQLIRISVFFLLGSFSLITSTQASTLAIDFDSEGSLYTKLAAEQPNNPINYSGTMLITSENGNLFSAGVFSNGKVRTHDNISGGVGARFYFIDSNISDIDNSQAIAFGGHLDIGLPFENLGVTADVYYSPTITTFGDAHDFLEFSFGVRWDVFENAGFYLGLRNTSIGRENDSDHVFSDGLHIGFKINL